MGAFNSAHIFGTLVPVEEPSTASKADSCVAAISAEPHREWTCYPEATPYEFLSAMEIEARAATKRNPKPSTQHRSGLGSLLPHLGF